MTSFPLTHPIKTYLSYHGKRDDKCPSDSLEGETLIMLRWEGL